jgi:pre-rRNA-processing protein IPI1
MFKCGFHFFALCCSADSLDQVEQALQDLNVVFCELTSLPILAYSTQPVGPTNSKKRDGMSVQKQVSQVKSYVARLLHGASMSLHTVGRRITTQDYMALLPTVWMLLNSNLAHSSVDEDTDTLSALLDHALQVSSAAAIKRPTVDFLVRLILVGFLIFITCSPRLNRSCVARDSSTICWRIQAEQRCSKSPKI